LSEASAAERDPAPLLAGAEWFPDTPGGLNRTFRLLFTGLAEAGLRSSAVVVGPARDAPPGVAVVSPGWLPLRMARFAQAITRLSSRANVVDVHFALYGLVAVIAARARRRPVLVHFHGPWAVESAVAGERGGIRLRAKHALERFVYRRAAIHVVHTLAFERLLVEGYGIQPWTVAIVPPAVDLEQFRPGDRSEARARFDIADDTRVAVTVRRITPRMGIDDLLRAWARVSNDVQLLIAGRGPDRARLEGIAHELGLERRVRFLGAVPDEALPDLYRAADVCVVPSRELEGFGLVIVEALACGTPVVVADAGGLPEAVAGLAHDLIVPAGDVAALAARLEGALSGGQPLPAPERCREHAEQFSLSRLIEAHTHLYSHLLAPPARRRRVVYIDRSDRRARSPAELIAMLGRAPGDHVHVVLGRGEALARALQRSGISVEVLPETRTAPAYVARLARRLLSLRPDLVQTVSSDSDGLDRVAARLARVPVAGQR